MEQAAAPAARPPRPRLASGPSDAPTTTGVAAGRSSSRAAAVREPGQHVRRRDERGELRAARRPPGERLRVPVERGELQQAGRRRDRVVDDPLAAQVRQDELLDAHPAARGRERVRVALAEPHELGQRGHRVRAACRSGGGAPGRRRAAARPGRPRACPPQVIEGVSGRPAASERDQRVHGRGEGEPGDLGAGRPRALRRLAHAADDGAQDAVGVLDGLPRPWLVQRVADRGVPVLAAVRRRRRPPWWRSSRCRRPAPPSPRRHLLRARSAPRRHAEGAGPVRRRPVRGLVAGRRSPP